MGQRSSPLRRAIVAQVAILFLLLTRILPLSMVRLGGVAAARIAYAILPRLHRVARENLDLAFGNALSPADKTRMARAAAINMAVVGMEFSRIPHFAKRNFDGLVSIEGEEHLEMGRGCLFIGAHLGNWEWMGPFMASRGHKVAEVVRPLDDPALNRRVDAIRTGGGVRTIGKDDAGREILKLLKEGWLIGVLVDQSPRDNAVPVTFFDTPCWATIAPVMIAVRAKVPVHPASIHRTASGTYTLRFRPAIEMVRSGNLREDLVTNTQRCQDAIEAIVREHPDQWLWFHRRWKQRQRLEDEWRHKQERESRNTNRSVR